MMCFFHSMVGKGSIVAVDYGKKRTGLAITDPLQIIASPLDTVDTTKLLEYLQNLHQTHSYTDLVVGMPMRAHGVVGELEEDIQKFIKKFQQQHPAIPIHRVDESFSSIRASEAIWQSGAKKKQRRDKANIDRVSAAIILQQFLESQI